MRIQSISIYNPKFASKSYDNFFDKLEENDNIHSFVQYEDADSVLREKIRSHYLGQVLPTDSTTTDCIVRYADCLEDTNILNLQNLSSGCYRGASLSKYPKYFHLLKKSGVNTVIDLIGDKKLKNSCAENNINYYPYIVDFGFWGHPIFKTDEELLVEEGRSLSEKNLPVIEYEKKLEIFKERIKQEREAFIIEFTKLLNVINQKGFYICCEQGEYRTPNTLSLNTFFNPKWNGIKTYPTDPFIYKKIKKMYDNLTAKDKILLSFTEAHEAFIKEHLTKIKNILF